MMGKSLEEMSAEELGKLFPIMICEHNPVWHDLFLQEKAKLEKVIGMQNILKLHHIGSTAVPRLPAKPTIDILLEVSPNAKTEELIHTMREAGYDYAPQLENPAPHMMFMKGYTLAGFKGQAYHVHVRYGGDWDELYFRDYLKRHSETAREYGKLKYRLQREYTFDRDGYTEAKTEFIRRITRLAREDLSASKER